MTPVLHHFVNGSPMTGSGPRHGDVFDPAIGELTRRVNFAARADVERAVAAAEAAFPSWSSTPPAARAQALFRFRQVLERDSEGLARTITSEHGKVLSDARAEVARCVEFAEFAAGIP